MPKDGKRVQRHSLLVKMPSPTELWAMIGDGDSTLSFPIPLDVYEDDSENEVEEPVSIDGIQTNQTPKETHKTLRSIMKKSKEFTEEKGLNALHLAFGFLNWTDNGTDGQEVRSPLILLPVKLTQDDLFSPIVLSRSDEEISSNHSLSQKLLSDFGVALPVFNEDVGLSEYLDSVAKSVSSLGWSISNDVAQLSMFSFMKINMYLDLERNAEKIANHHIVRTLNGEALRDSANISDIGTYNHDKTEPQEVFSVVDADSSQQDAILLAKRGASFVLQGPPGTGKSQTITNMIAELIADGKKVLFVSEKMAALEVVHKRLTKVGLAPFCLTLHSHNANRREILDQLDKTIKMSRQKASLQQDAYNILYRLKEVRSALNQYSSELHDVVEPLGKTIYQVTGYLAQYENYPNIDFTQINAEKFTPSLLAQCESALEEVTRIVSESGYQQDNPWKGCVLTLPPTFEFRQKFIIDSEDLLAQIELGLALFAETNSILSVNNDWGIFNVDEVCNIYDFAITSPMVSPSWLSLDLEDIIKELFNYVAALNTKSAAMAVLRNFPIDSAHAGHDLCEHRKTAWEMAQSSLLQNYDAKILTLDIASMANRYRTQYRSFFSRIGGEYSKDRKSLLGLCKTAKKISYEQGLSLLDTIGDVLNKKTAYENQVVLTDSTHKLNALANKINRLLGVQLEIFENLDKLKSALEWCIELKNLMSKFSFGSDFVSSVCEKNDTLFKKMDLNKKALKDWSKAINQSYGKFAVLFDSESGLQEFSLLKLSERVKKCKDNFASLEYLIDYHIAEKRLADLQIDSYLEKAKEVGLIADEIIPIFKKCFFRSWLDAVIPKHSAISDFRRLRQDERVTLFRELDKSHLEISKAIVLSKLISRLPNFDAFSANGEIALLRREMAKQRKLMPTRLLIANLPNLLSALKPCVMMSPLSISTYLGSSNFEFDVVIFDEASQVRTEDAIGAIFRAKQVIIAGDSKQLPPTDFFASSMSASDIYEEDEDGEIDDTGAYESLLDEASMLPTQTLLWHYRSRHEHLIAFSNAKIYQGNLTTFPSAAEKADGMGVEYIHMPGGTYDRGGKNGNKSEAVKVAELVFEHFRTHPERSLGIIAFGEVQQSAIIDALIEKRRANPTFEPFFKEGEDESLFIKNLETVQGDERDTIIFSIGYAPDATGKFTMNFGPLSRDGGERRLNVAVTRARYNLKLVGSILPTDISVERVSGQGPKLLRQYIDFAINGATAILGELTVDENLWFDSPFEISVYDFLTKNGYDVVTQVGCSGYRIDMAVKHPKYNGRFAIGVECDGAMYHSARTARERDRLRQTVLEDMGWKIYRIWSTDWIKDRHTEGIRLLEAVKNAIDNYRELIPISNTHKTAKAEDFLEVSTQTAYERVQEGVQQKFSAVRSRYYGWLAKEIPSKDMSETMMRVLENDFGLDRVGLFKETALYGYGWQRQGGVIKSKFELALNSLLKQGIVSEDSDGKLKINISTKN